MIASSFADRCRLGRDVAGFLRLHEDTLRKLEFRGRKRYLELERNLALAGEWFEREQALKEELAGLERKRSTVVKWKAKRRALQTELKEASERLEGVLKELDMEAALIMAELTQKMIDELSLPKEISDAREHDERKVRKKWSEAET